MTLGPDIRFIWPYLFEKCADDDNPKYKVTILIPKSNKVAMERVNAAIDEAIDRGMSGSGRPEYTFKKGTKESSLNIPLHDGIEKADDEKYAWMYEGYHFMTLRTDRRPSVLDANGQQIIDPAEFRMGCKGAVSVTFAPYNNKSQGVGAYLNHVMVLEESDYAGGGFIDASEAFIEFTGRSAVRPARESRSRVRSGSDDPMFE